MENLKKALLEQFDLVFSDETLLETAFTHTSYANEHRLLKISHNERLEFLGDAVLQLIISEYLYTKYPKRPEGDLSKLRSMIVREESLAGFARDCQFDQFIKLGRGEEKSGGRNRDTILGDLFEAFLGALLLDKGVEAVKSFLYQVMIPKVEAGDFERVTDYKTKLQELLQINGDVEIAYQVVSETGPAHAKNFEVAVLINGRKSGQGQGRSKKLAEQEAAKNAFEKESSSCF
ncbi:MULTISPECIES: ribonuclease III [Streptococcus]|jgi:ribonuclease III|uniref:Ribonuclease 3 n=6 Tax=Streptococcus sanguinis TaxID=1305 RepID=RNC_STRSV|nr:MULTISPECIES: ribonuclease III [Streptococcus]A3CP46.1 RecName: Full=Ribonuclease 3; AltName: Full=Ribonuclease III; Short=RNase III [Streptococcus sanguinis SK36]MBF1690203.1 ribonuclease III [Streptococcus cristatus]PLA65311.1 ribonuclease 3 [Streptococcus salivarius]ABN44951.1 Ribonuclease III, putative [Streptococcus sanguinis SK36]EGC26736.1 ribonuclease III [Streptococcus sanguinis SK678]EGD29286.1 ribonuclease III [Streptococcus sanguinis SK72]